MSSFLVDFIASAPNFPKAECAKVPDPDIFFADDARVLAARAQDLKSICFACEHRIDCLNYAIKENINEGFWGGMLPKEREALQPPKKMGRKRKSNKGQRAAEMRSRGMSWPMIGEELNISAQAAQMAYRRFMDEQKAAS